MTPAQPDLFLGTDHAACSKGWGSRCAKAKSKRCRCACGGRNHGNPAARGKGDETMADEKPMRAPTPGFSYVPTREVRPVDVTAFRARRAPGGEAIIETVNEAGEVKPFRQRYRYHSDGFEFGYHGSGPADLALNICAKFVGPLEAWRMHQEFKFDVLGEHFKTEGGELPASTVRDWIEAFYARETAASTTPETET